LANPLVADLGPDRYQLIMAVNFPISVRGLLARLPIERLRNPPPVVAVLRLAGIISGANLPLRGTALNLATMAGPIERAFGLRGVRMVALSINSPGGSPVQSALIAGRIRQLSAEKNVPVIAFAEDVAASGGYWLALAADEIYADANSIIGSIGVVSAGFGFVGLIDRLGVERRLRTSGDKKSFHDPFLPEKSDDLARLDRLMAEMHANFRTFVRERRGARIGERPDDEIFSGEFWTGARAKELGLIDGLGDLRSVMRGRYGDKVRLALVTDRGSWLRRRLGLPMGSGWADELVAAAEARAMWARYGL
jgi:signal peptide peptidase SppA